MTILSLVTFIGFAQNPVKVTKNGNTFVATKTNASTGYTKTDFVYVDTDGKSYVIYTHKITKGDRQGQTVCYIQKVSKKTGKTYWKEIPVKSEDLR